MQLNNIRGFYLLLPAFLLLAMTVTYQASVMEDAYISFRVTDNIVQGYGPTWNIMERVQPFTNPLWTLLHVPFYALWQNIYFVDLLISAICLLLAIALPLKTFPRPALATASLFLLPLALSRSFAVYSTSGFENPLEHALFGCFFYILFTRPRRYWFWLSFLTALSMVNRLDTLVLFVPVWLCLLMARRRDMPWRALLLGGLPILLWECFSLFYYGFAFPNTKYAKLHTGIAQSEYVTLGGHYILNLLAVDVIGAAVILCSVSAIPFLYRRWKNGRREDTLVHLGLALGVLAYVLYVVSVGGTYLSGRLFSLPIYVSACLLLAVAGNSLRPRALITLAAMCFLIVAFYPSAPTLFRYCPPCFKGVDPHDHEVKHRLLDYVQGKITLPAPRSVISEAPVFLEWSMGKWGFEMDRRVHVIDGFAIVDPLLARLPVSVAHIQTMGMTPRALPAGYWEAVRTGDTHGMDPDLAAYYEKLRFIISGDLWSMTRLMEIFRFNRGDYDDLLERYVARVKKPI